MDFVSVC